MKNLPIELLRGFVAVAHLGSFTKAGRLVGRSQPAISLQIKRLEERLGKVLVVRDGHSLGLSEAGNIMLRYAERILNLNDEAIAQLHVDAVGGRVRFGIPSEFATTLLPKIVRRFNQAYPNVTLEVKCDLSVNLQRDLSQDLYDLALVLQYPEDQRIGRRLKIDELVWVASPGWAPISDQPIPLIAAPQGCLYRARATNGLNEHGLAWSSIYTIADLSGIESAIEAGLGVTVLAKTTVPKSLRIVARPELLPPLGEITVNIVANPRRKIAATSRLEQYIAASLH